MEKGKRDHTSGLRNLGNTCYLNSILQCLSHSPSLMNYITDHEFDEDLHTNTPSGLFTTEFRKLLVQLWIRNGVVHPGPFKQVADTGMLQRESFGLGAQWQNDAHEFLEYILDTLHNSLQYQPRISISVKSPDDQLNETDKMAIEAYQRWKGNFSDGYSSIIDLFYGQYLSEVRKGDEISRCYDPYQVMTLQIPESTTSEVTIMDCFEAFMAPETIDEHTSRRFYFWKTPQNLIVSLKRFRNDGTKDTTRIVYREMLDLSKYSKGYQREKIIYALYGICCHQGNGGQFGHYISLCRKKGSPQWYKHDDEGVEALGNGGALPMTSTAYILFYHRME